MTETHLHDQDDAIELVVEHTIEILEIIIAPKQETSFQINDFDLSDLDKINYQPVEDRLLGRDLANQSQSVTFGKGEFISHDIDPTRYLVELLAKKSDLDYEEDGPLLTKLADQLVAHLKRYLNSPVEVNNIVINHQKHLTDFIHEQITANKSGPPVDYEATVKKGFKLLRPQIVTGLNDCIADFRNAVNPVSDTPEYIFTGFKKCGYPAQKFQSNPKQQFAVLLEDETRAEVVRWMKPAQNQFSINYADGKKYNPDFVIETPDEMIVAEIKAPNQIDTSDIQSKKDAMIMWIKHVNAINKDQSKKQWTYLLIDSSKLDAASTLNGLKATYKVI